MYNRSSKCSKAPIGSAPSVDIRQPRLLSVSTDPEIVERRVSSQKAAPLYGPDLKQQKIPWNGVAVPPKPGDGGVDGDVSFHKPVRDGGSQTTSVHPSVQHVGVRGSTVLVLPDTVTATSSRSIPSPFSSAGLAPPSFDNQQPTSFTPYARAPHLRESSAVLCLFHLYQLAHRH